MGFFKLNVDKMARNRDIKGLAKALLDKKDLDVRNEAASALDVMQDLDKETDSQVTVVLVDAIKEANRPTPIKDAQARTKMANSNRYVQFTAGRVLGKMGKTAIKPLVHGITDDLGSMDVDQKYQVRATIALLLQNQAEKLDRVEIDQLITSLHSNDPSVMRASAMVLGYVHDQKVIDALIGLLGDKSTASYGEIAQALGNIGDPKAIDPLIIAMKMGCASEEYATALGKFNDVRTVQPLIDVLKTCIGSDHDYAQPSSIIKTLSLLGDQRAIEPLSAFLSHQSTYEKGSEVTRSYLARALGHLGDGSVAAVLLRTLNTDPDENVRCEAARALEELSARNQLGVSIEIVRIGLKASAEAGTSSVKVTAAEVLSKLPKPMDDSPVTMQQIHPEQQESSMANQVANIINDYSEFAMIEEIAKILVQLDRKSNQEYATGDKTTFENTRESIVTVGTLLNQEGKEELMRKVLLQAGAYGCNMRFIEREWDGIGSWRG